MLRPTIVVLLLSAATTTTIRRGHPATPLSIRRWPIAAIISPTISGLWSLRAVPAAPALVIGLLLGSTTTIGLWGRSARRPSLWLCGLVVWATLWVPLHAVLAPLLRLSPLVATVLWLPVVAPRSWSPSCLAAARSALLPHHSRGRPTCLRAGLR